MEKINLKEILAKHNNGSVSLTTHQEKKIINAMQEVWNLAVDKCKEKVKLTEFAFEFMQEGAYEAIDLDSLEQVKQLI